MNRWGEFLHLDKYALKYFQWMQARSKKGWCSCSFSNDRQGYIDFCREMGPIPDSMIKPSVGRKDHTLGYQDGNIAWQEFVENCKQTNRQKISANSKLVSERLWKDKDWSEERRLFLRSESKKEKQSEFMKGKRHAAGKRSGKALENIIIANQRRNTRNVS